MALTPGSRIGPYEIAEPIGAGGMGEVFRARDVSLGRAAAIKVLPASLAGDPERMARFEREAQTLAALNHPNIAQIFGFEKGEGQFRAIAMEFVEGPTLADRIAAGPIPVDEAIAIAVQIAEALESAHDNGIIHRDLKPANVKVRPDGTVKVLDFGLAKAITPVAEASGLSANSPTITTPAMTIAGVILGTAAYMSPEQAKGRVVDRRTDIWAFGCLLFEMLSGKRLFGGGDTSEVIVSILRDDPPWKLLPASTPPHVRSLLRRCLMRDPRRRLPHIGEARLELTEPPAPVEPSSGSGRSWPLIAAASIVAMAIGAAAMTMWPRSLTVPAEPIRLNVDLGTDAKVGIVGQIALAPDGQSLAFVGRPIGNDSARATLYLRHFDRLEAQMIPGTEGAGMPFFSPDGKWIAFFAEGQLRKVAIDGGQVALISQAQAPRGGWWSDDDAIIFALPGALLRVSSSGGQPEPLLKLAEGELSPLSPQLLPGGRAVMYSEAYSADPGVGTVVVRELPAGPRKVVAQGARLGRFVPSGHITFVRTGTLFAVPFDLATLEPRGDPVAVVEGVHQTLIGAAPIAFISANGTLAYQPGTTSFSRRSTVMWLGKGGGLTPLTSDPSSWTHPRFSPDGRRLAMAVSDGRQADIWVYDWPRDIMTRVTSDPAADLSPVWTPDGTGLVFGSSRGSGTANLYWQRADGTGAAQRLSDHPQSQFPDSFDPSGRWLVSHEGDPATSRQELVVRPFEGNADLGVKTGPPKPFVSGAFLKANARISPDGKWVAYAANPTERFEIYVQPFPGPGERVQVSSGGGNLAVWSPYKSELYYVGPAQTQLMVVPYSVSGQSFVPEKPRPWAEARFSAPPPMSAYGPGFDIHPDGERFAVAPLSETANAVSRAEQLILFYNFFDELRRRAPPR
jgi:Tol biopolymer transport system component